MPIAPLLLTELSADGSVGGVHGAIGLADALVVAVAVPHRMVFAEQLHKEVVQALDEPDQIPPLVGQGVHEPLRRGEHAALPSLVQGALDGLASLCRAEGSVEFDFDLTPSNLEIQVTVHSALLNVSSE